ncbi:hypothetical protein SPRG_10764 [Saprolegnia parasitica CBS 223.65]|uniref:BRCT domain-containing protein n=1 Tax=Saprolegnia parasitica (strain CBS 223.65) TaxID=695850 RepID=A0A067BYG5_SAPPC|nr:hypothetical protein SPRG_10764 [Saprolegnia parasitica CBS 223.65]KDO23569.1 hypothetical protein SPRG_10764 [Saprolegnia parasitica CBS 223.65]|eukprot:XP_012205719.1 hypothetical protein SPRG_10764 [Saprolegnia parasitica CBS 223.65]
MEGLIITLSGFTVRSTPSRDDMQAMIRLVGACWLPVLSRSHTSHLICFEASGEKYQRARTWDLQNVVTFEWILECVKQWRYVPEAEFSWEPRPPKMPKFDVHDALQVLEAKPLRSVTPLKPKEPETAFVSTLTTPVLLRSTQPDATDVLASAPTAPIPAMATASVKTSAKTSARTSAQTTAKAVAMPVKKAAVTPARGKKAATKRASPSSDASVSVLEVVVSRPAAAKKTPKETKRKGKTQSEPETSDVVVLKQRRTTARSKTPKRMFLLTGTHEELAINESIVQFLGGVVVHSARAFDPACTHVICKELRRTEKIIAACASGKWILTPEYLRDSRAQGLFLSEEGYEWGLDKVSKDHYCDPRIWLPVAKYWRTHLAAGGARAFDNWTFAILGETVPPPSMCTHVIVAAGGVVLDVAALIKKFQAHDDLAPMVVLVADAVKKTDKVLKILLEKKVPLVKPGFLIDYITKDQHARPELQLYYYLP